MAYSDWAGASRVDELNDGVRVVVEVLGQGSIGEFVAVLGDEVLEIGGDLLGIGVAHTLSSASGHELVAEGGFWRSEDAGREGGGCNDDGAHFDWI